MADQREATLKDDRRESRVPEQFAGLLHGSSPACESPDNPYQLYSRVRKDPPQRHGNLLLAPNHAVPFPASKIQKEPKPQVVYRTIFHTRVNQKPSVQGKNDVNRTGEGGNNSTGGYEERACTLGRMRSGMSRNVPDLQLSRSLSKSDSNLVVASPIEEERRNSRGQNSPTRLERTPSFTAEWEEVITFHSVNVSLHLDPLHNQSRMESHGLNLQSPKRLRDEFLMTRGAMHFIT